MTRPFSDYQKLRILIAHGAVIIGGAEPLKLSHVLWPTRDAAKRFERLQAMPMAVQCACGGRLSTDCDGTVWLRLADVEFDHTLADVFGGATHQSNGRPLAPACHARKSAAEHAGNSRAKRLHKKHFGLEVAKPKRAWTSRPLKSRSSWPKCPFPQRREARP